MASTICASTFWCSSVRRRSAIFSISDSVVLCSQRRKSFLSTSNPVLGLSSFPRWYGLRHVGISIKQKSIKTGRMGRCRGKVVYASLFGVGAPEALVIGVVALLVFGPKGLAEVARNLGKTLRAFQPTIRELQDVSREFKTTLEREIGLDEDPPSMQNSNRSTSATSSLSSSNSEKSPVMPDLNGTPASEPSSSEDQSQGETSLQDGNPPAEKPLNIGEFLVQAQLRSSASLHKQENPLQEAESETQPEPQPQPQATAPETDPKIPAPTKIESEI